MVCVFFISGYSWIFCFSASVQLRRPKGLAFRHPDEEQIGTTLDIPGLNNLLHIYLAMNMNLKLCIEIKLKNKCLEWKTLVI